MTAIAAVYQPPPPRRAGAVHARGWHQPPGKQKHLLITPPPHTHTQARARSDPFPKPPCPSAHPQPRPRAATATTLATPPTRAPALTPSRCDSLSPKGHHPPYALLRPCSVLGGSDLGGSDAMIGPSCDATHSLSSQPHAPAMQRTRTALSSQELSAPCARDATHTHSSQLTACAPPPQACAHPPRLVPCGPLHNSPTPPQVKLDLLTTSKVPFKVRAVPFHSGEEPAR